MDLSTTVEVLCGTSGAADPVELAGVVLQWSSRAAAPRAALQRSPAGCRAAVQRSVPELADAISAAQAVMRPRGARQVRCCNGALAGGSRCSVAALVGGVEAAVQQLGAPMEFSPAAPGAPLQPSSVGSKLQCSTGVPMELSPAAPRAPMELSPAAHRSCDAAASDSRCSNGALVGSSRSCDAADGGGSGVAMQCFAPATAMMILQRRPRRGSNRDG